MKGKKITNISLYFLIQSRLKTEESSNRQNLYNSDIFHHRDPPNRSLLDDLRIQLLVSRSVLDYVLEQQVIQFSNF